MKKIMFNDHYGLTQAVLNGTKTQTRRIVPKDFFTQQWDIRDDTLVFENQDGDFIDIRDSKYIHFKVGEIVAVAQSYKDCGIFDVYRAPEKTAGWNNKMFVRADLMPHQIRITNVRIERLQDISDEDCIKEGVIEETFMEGLDDYGCPAQLSQGFYFGNPNVQSTMAFDTPREAYAALIDKVSSRGTWDSNPYVFVYDFELAK